MAKEKYTPAENRSEFASIRRWRMARRLMIATALGVGGMTFLAGQNPALFADITKKVGETATDFSNRLIDASKNLKSGQFATDASNLLQRDNLGAVVGGAALVGGGAALLTNAGLEAKESDEMKAIDSKTKA